jgi:hypothetical protein
MKIKKKFILDTKGEGVFRKGMLRRILGPKRNKMMLEKTA